MNTKVLVAYASKYGATKEIAEKIGQVLKDAGFTVDTLPADRVEDLAPFQAVVLGSAVYIGGWRKQAARFLKVNEKALAGKMVWLFSSGPTGQGDPIELVKGWHFPKALQHIADRVKPKDIVLFQGAAFPEEAERYQPLDDEKSQSTAWRFPRLERDHGLGWNHCCQAQRNRW